MVTYTQPIKFILYSWKLPVDILLFRIAIIITLVIAVNNSFCIFKNLWTICVCVSLIGAIFFIFVVVNGQGKL